MHDLLLSLAREAIALLLATSAPALVAALVAGLASGALQATTQIQDQSLSVVPRVAAVLVAVGCTGPWVAARLVRFTAACLDLVTRAAS